MDHQFKIGEIAIIYEPGWFLHGTECEVIGIVDVPGLITSGFIYRTMCVDSIERAAKPNQLRKKRPPATFEGELRIIQLFGRAPVQQPEEVAR